MKESQANMEQETQENIEIMLVRQKNGFVKADTNNSLKQEKIR